ncbi:SUMF1/EgtB/PvdO family nonheme iron enzyme [Pseudosulfitobacter sp. DSM 107133]|uniref:formylglycine-generating enzyme family protein n=1 Tax=Pseudosulfitobacter sp. DSM 107133 TaxID=2883100 RepID=UPI001FAD5143|nr:SUMF1/EgtB/PvdO family nonheme iron enzyme [Pseudosulfitobacter sp. DSM 107133]
MQVVSVPAGEVRVHLLGSFSKDDKTIDPPGQTLQVPSFQIMKYQVTRGQYSECVQMGICDAVTTDARTAGAALPQTQVSWRDATRYADWMSGQTGQRWRLPSVGEWQRAAAERYPEQAGRVSATFTQDPGARMLAQYENGKIARVDREAALQPVGALGENSLGIADMAGHVWEWTDGCFARGVIRPDGSLERSADYCGVRIAAGAHHAAVIHFVRDASVGGCAVGLPPDHLGFRLVRSF